MRRVKIIIWKWKEKLHEGIYEFKNLDEAAQFQLGLYEGFRLCGMEPTGMALRLAPRKKEA